MKIILDVPDRIFNESAETMTGRIRLYAAILMFHAGEISAGAAAEFASVDRFTFAAECSRLGVSVIDYPPDELEREVQMLRRAV